ncbi:hypothetical protein CCMSSC00406_0000561 [Pleurotus cornucopiae]|uniref:Uncharacterized protein n=1 Tax=Pleurotus cornucopiae TaxID=5321 RepID=A0ACB7JD09_PLECO|nr:hypothetical protein CCMSSC00406_0000561 [Pleurotus cornucopiae]
MLIWRQLCHPNILPLMGLYIPNDSPSRLCLVSPWMENGNVHQYLTKYPCANRAELLIDIASGLNYLHALRPKIIHGDLKGLNILVTPMHRACLADFGVSIVATESCFKWSGVGVSRAGTLRWLAPELLDGSCPHNTLQTDIYAFAFVCYELYSGNIPFHDLKRDGQVIVLVSQGHRPTRPGHISDGVWSLVQECWEQEPSARPTSREIMDRLLYQGKPSRSFALPYPIRNHYIVVKKRAALLSNYEVLTLLRELEIDHLTRAKTALKVKKEEGGSNLNAGAGKDVRDVDVSENLRTMEVEAIQYFASDIQPAPYQTPEGIRQLLRSLAPYNLTKAEKLQIVNIAPQSMPVLWAIIEEMEDRMTVDQMQEIIRLVQNSLTKDIKEPNQPNLHLMVGAIGEDQDAYGDDDGYMDVVDDAQFDDTGEGAGVEGDLDVDDD